MKIRIGVLLIGGLIAGAGSVSAQTPPPPKLRSSIYVYRMSDGTSHRVFQADTIWEAPTWSPDGKSLIANSGGTLYRMDLQADGSLQPQRLAIPAEYHCNNDKGLSPDGRLLAFSATKAPAKGSNVYLANADGTNIHALTTIPNSYFHGWTPDGNAVLFVAQRHGETQFDLYRMPKDGGAETRLTSDTHHDDGPDPTPGGKWVYFNSDRSGQEAIWRMPSEGAGHGDAKAEKMIADGDEDWFPHLSPDGRTMVYIAYPKGTATHDPRQLSVKLMTVRMDNDRPASTPRALLAVRGGQGTLNVNSWSPDGRAFAYVSYEAVP